MVRKTLLQQVVKESFPDLVSGMSVDGTDGACDVGLGEGITLTQYNFIDDASKPDSSMRIEVTFPNRGDGLQEMIKADVKLAFISGMLKAFGFDYLFQQREEADPDPVMMVIIEVGDDATLVKKTIEFLKSPIPEDVVSGFTV